MTHAKDDNRGRQLAVGVGIIVFVTITVCGVLIGWRYLPGLLGEWIGTMIGVMTTPFLLEGSFVVIFLTVVVAINSWRRKREGDELVYLEQVDGPDVPPGMPEQAKWAVYRQQPLAGEIPTLRAQAEGALAIGDFDSAAEAIASMTEAELKTPETLALRIELAKATGRSDLAGQLESELGDSVTRKL